MNCSKMVDLGGYVIILVETQDKKVKLYGKNTNMLFFLFLVGWKSNTLFVPYVDRSKV